MTKVSLVADKIQVRSHLIGDNNKITFDIGNYEIEKVAKLLLIPEQTEINLEVSWKDGKSD